MCRLLAMRDSHKYCARTSDSTTRPAYHTLPRTVCHLCRVCLGIQPAECLSGYMRKEDGDVGAFGRHVGGDGGDAVGEAEAV